MAVRTRQTFKGINTDISPNLLASGTADVALNVLVSTGSLEKRAGFAELEDDIDGSGTAVLSMAVARYATGAVYLVAKLATGTLWHRRIYPTDAGSFTQVVLTSLGYTSNIHSTADAGWWFMWADRLYYVDRVGVTKMYLPTPSVWRGGVCQPSTGPSIAQAAGGQKDGRYHVAMAYRNSKTQEEGIVTAFSTGAGGPLQCDLSNDLGGIAISNFASTINALPATNTDAAKYEWDQAVFYCTMGGTEFIGRGSGHECYSYRAYVDLVKDCAHDGSGTAGCNKADHVLAAEEMLTNAGGLPPGSLLGAFNGQRAVYANLYEAGSLVPGQIRFSLPGKPTMVPRPATYTTTNDVKTLWPKPWDGTIYSGLDGLPTACAAGGGSLALFTETSFYSLLSSGSGRLYPALRHGSKGCSGAKAAIGTPRAIHALGHNCWLTVANDQWADIAVDRFAGLLDEIPVAYEGLTVMGYYGHADQVWAAVVKSGATVAQRILVWDPKAADGEGALTYFEPACLAAGEGIVAMAELAVPGADPVMCIATSAGRILKYPVGDDDDGTDFACDWRGWFGMERRVFDQALVGALFRNGSNVAGNVAVGFRAYRAAGETDVSQHTATLSKSNGAEAINYEISEPEGNLFQIEISSTASVSTRWTIHDLVLTCDRTDKKR